MPTKEELLKELGLDEEKLKPKSKIPEKPIRTEPLTDIERIVVNNIFDTQPARRVAYLKQRGLELDPNDDNKIRPIGSKGKYAEIDPGINAYFKKGGIQELGKDMADVLYDFGVEAPIMTGAVLGAGTLAAPTGPGAIAAGVAGGAAGKVASETIKNTVGDILLEESIPSDKKLMAIQGVFAGIAPSVLKGGVKAAGGGLQALLNLRTKALVNMAKGAGGQLDEELITAITRDPERFSESKVKGASQKMLSLYEEMFGDNATAVKDTKQIKPETLFGKALAPLRAAQQKELQALDANPKAAIQVEEITQPMIDKIKELSSRFDLSSEEEAGLNYLKKKVETLNSKTVESIGGKTPLSASGLAGVKRPLKFSEAREVLDVIQDDAYNREIPGTSIIREIAGGNAEQNQIRGFLDRKAAEAGSKLPEINADMSKKLKVFQMARDNITPSNLTSAFVGKGNVQKEIVKSTFDLMDQELGTQMGKRVQDGTFDMVVENIYKNPQAFGSGGVIPSIVQGAVVGAAGGAGLGAGSGMAIGSPAIGGAVGAIGGGLIGASAGAATSTPAKAIQSLAKSATQEESLAKFLSKPETVRSELLNQAMASAIGPSDAITRESAFEERQPKQPTREDLLRELGLPTK